MIKTGSLLEQVFCFWGWGLDSETLQQCYLVDWRSTERFLIYFPVLRFAASFFFKAVRSLEFCWVGFFGGEGGMID